MKTEIKQGNLKPFTGLTLPFKYSDGRIIDGAGKEVVKANRDANETCLSPYGRDTLLKVIVELLNNGFEYDQIQKIVNKLS